MAKPHSAASLKVGQRIATARYRAGITAKALAECADLDVTHMQRIERGEMNPTLSTLAQVAIALEVDLGELVTGITADELQVGRRPYGYSHRRPGRRRSRSDDASDV